MIENYSNALLIEDRWGDLPLTDALYAEASMQVIHSLFQAHKLWLGALPNEFCACDTMSG